MVHGHFYCIRGAVRNPAASTIFLSSYCNMVGVEVTSFAYSNKHTVTDSEYPQVQRKLAP